jgi:hypothetical protein
VDCCETRPGTSLTCFPSPFAAALVMLSKVGASCAACTAVARSAADEPPLELSERAGLREVVRRTRELEIENAFLKKQQRTSQGSSGGREIRVHRRCGFRHCVALAYALA